MTVITKIELIDKVKTFYEQYLYFKDIHYAFLDIEGAFDHQEKAKTFLGVVACALSIRINSKDHKRAY